LKGNVRDSLAFDPHIHGHLVAAQRVAAVRGAAGIVDRAEVPRVPDVVHDELVVRKWSGHSGVLTRPGVVRTALSSITSNGPL
jgi:hypothetical protein